MSQPNDPPIEIRRSESGVETRVIDPRIKEVAQPSPELAHPKPLIDWSKEFTPEIKFSLRRTRTLTQADIDAINALRKNVLYKEPKHNNKGDKP